MIDYADTGIICPNCKMQNIRKQYYRSAGALTTWWRLYCPNSVCSIDTGHQFSMSHAYEVLMAEYFGANVSFSYTITVDSDT